MVNGVSRLFTPGPNTPSSAEARPSTTGRVFLAVGAGMVVVYILVPGHLAKDVIYLLVAAASVFCILRSTVRNRLADPVGWYLLAVAAALFLLGDAVVDFDDLVLHVHPDVPSAADWLSLAGYPFLFLGVYRIACLRRLAGARERWAEATMVGLGSLSLISRFLLDPYLQVRPLSASAKVVLTAYPVMDIGVLFVLSGAVMSGVAWRVADQMLVLAVAAMVAADLGYDSMTMSGSYVVGGNSDVAYLVSYIVLAGAALHPSVSRPLETPRPDQVLLERRWVLPVIAAGLAPPVVLLITALAGEYRDIPFLAGLSIAVFILVLFRMHWLFRRLRNKTVELEQNTESLMAAMSKESRHQSEMMYLSLHDSLTGLPNRVLLHDRIDHSLAVRRFPTTVALCVCGLDDFTAVNDAFGHDVGDQLLVLVGRRLTTMAQGSGTVARLGGDEFAILLEATDGRDGAAALAERVVAVVHLPMTVAGHQIELSVSVGVAISAPHSSTDRLLTESEAALREVKANGKGSFAVFEQLLRDRATDRRTLINSFPGSLSNGDFFLEYQPQYRMTDGHLVGFEALVRWSHPVLGVVSPNRFISLAEETGFIVPLGRWVLETACAEAAAWPMVGNRPIPVSVNVSGRQMQNPTFLQDILAISGRAGLDCSALILEITETVLMVDPSRTITTLQALRRLGIRIAVDDFGTGYSSLSYLRQFPVDILKIDKSFIDPLHDPDGEGIAFVQMILRLAQDLHLATVAEGIEESSQWDTLVQLGCHEAQGFFMSPPVNASTAMGMITGALTNLARAGGDDLERRRARARLQA